MDKNQKFLQIEIEYIETAKFFEGIKLNKDPGNFFVCQWIQDNAAKLRAKWDLSKCQHCNFWRVCGYLVKQDCIDFEPDKDEEIESLESEDL